MGRKKIEIRPLTDERNRNVTFLKRKAGLMKKAWELSVLCGADVSILIFSSQGKAYEFSSKELDGEIDKYLDYEGLIERRRAEEFAAMAAAGEDDDDDEDDNGRRGSTSKLGPTGQPTKSLKGKESFKARQPSRNEIERMLAKAKDKDHRRRSHKRRTRRVREDGRGRSFVDDLVSDGDTSDSESDRDRDEGRRKRRRDDGPDDGQPGLAGLQYALSMHQAPALPSAEAEQLPNFFAHSQNSLPRPSPAYRSLPGSAAGFESWSSGSLGPDAQYGYLPQHPSHPIPGPHGAPGNMQWNQELLTRYAEFQLQQNHQKQQRALLERQRAQMADLGIPVDDRGLLDQIFGGHTASMVSPAQDVGSTQSSGNVSGNEPFEWPQVSSARSREEAGKDSMYGYANPDEQRYAEDGIPWGMGNGERVALPTPPSPGMKRRDEGYGGGLEDRRRLGVSL